MSPLHFLQRPARWLRAITKYGAQVSGGPNFAYDLCVRKVDLAAEQLDLSSWSLAFDGAEVVRAATLDAFAAKFGAVGFRRSAFVPCYGLAEATLLVSSTARAEEPRVRDDAGIARVSCGRPAPSVEVTIVDGEICVAGPSVGRGYWGQAPFEQPLRTGDLGELHDGELYVTGRVKDLIVFSGRKLHPDDIERVACAAHPALRAGCTVAFAADVDDVERLVIVQEVERDHDPAAVRAAITRAVVEGFDIAPHAIVLLPPAELPKTSSGKVQRHACKDAWLRGQMRGE
jgi:acyl-CoA synthetase (AMP-forming)/AMP-acid ligase II